MRRFTVLLATIIAMQLLTQPPAIADGVPLESPRIIAMQFLTQPPAIADGVPLESPRIIAAYTADADTPADPSDDFAESRNYLPQLRAALYAACLADAITTAGAVRRGAYETDPLVAPVAHNTPALIGTEVLWAWTAEHLLE
ncbi:MAG: hypothetical protein ACYCW6_30155, partial [Candidatus Xenobia bacterium]